MNEQVTRGARIQHHVVPGAEFTDCGLGRPGINTSTAMADATCPRCLCTSVSSWRCEMHGVVTSGDCPRCDDELIALADELFVRPDGENEPTLWRGDPEDNPSAVLRRCDLPSQHRDLWGRIADTLSTPPGASS